MAERLEYLDFEDGDVSLSVDDQGKYASFRAIDSRAEIEVCLLGPEVDALIAWLATWKENQES